MSSRNLVPGQYQLGDTLFGKHTLIKVSGFDEQAYNVAAQDLQFSRSDEIAFGIDPLQPQPITLEMSILDNRRIPGIEAWTGVTAPADIDQSGPDALRALTREWRADETRKNWGAIKPLYCCGRDGITRVVYGRPRKFHSSKQSEKSEVFSVTAEFARADTLCYTEEENYIDIFKGDTPIVVRRTGGDSPSWFRVVGFGPLTHPIVTVGEHQIELDLSIAEGEAFEISSYPWRRRAIDSNGKNIGAKLIGDAYLDRMTIPFGKWTPIRWTSADLSTWLPALGNVDYNIDIDELNKKNLPNTFITLAGKVAVRFDLFNPDFAEKFIASDYFGGRSAILYKKKKFNTANQYVECKPVESFRGSSGIVIMSNETMTNYALLEVATAISGDDKLNIRVGTGPESWSTVKSSWTNPSAFTWKETDVIGFGYNPTTDRYEGYFNGDVVVWWEDSTNLISTGASNRSQGFLFDMDGNLFTVGTGFREIVAYDRATVPAPVGRIVVLFHDAWSRII